MIKILSVHRKLTLGEEAKSLKIVNPNCNVVISTDETYNKGHFSLTDEEAKNFDLLCRTIENRIAEDIGNEYRGLAALQPPDPKPLATEASAGQ